MNQLIPDLKCPITRQLINEIGITSDGKIYEKSAIEKWLRDHSISPLTGLPIAEAVYSCDTLQEKLNDFYQMNSKYKKRRYQKSTNHCDNISEIRKIICHKNFEKLIQFSEFEWNLFDIECLEALIKNADVKYFKYVIDNMSNLEYEDSDKWRPIHYVCYHGSSDRVNLLIDKGVDLKCETNNKCQPIHYVCQKGSIDSLKMLIKKGIDLECETMNGWRPIHAACRWQKIEMIQLLINQNVDLKTKIKMYKSEKISLNCLNLINRNDVMTVHEKKLCKLLLKK